jgi:predicted PP-loop superfamily ATPase
MIMRWFVLCGDGGIFPRHLLRFFLRLNDVVFVWRFFIGENVNEIVTALPLKKYHPCGGDSFIVSGTTSPKNNEVETICIGHGKFSQIFQYVGIIPQR